MLKNIFFIFSICFSVLYMSLPMLKAPLNDCVQHIFTKIP